MAREDVEDHGGAIDHRNAGCVFEGALLRRRELVIGDHDVGAQTFGFAADLLCLALPHPPVGIGRSPLLQRLAHDDAGRRLDESPELVERVLSVEARSRELDAHEVGLLGRGAGVDHAAASRIRASGSSRVGSNQRISGSRRNQVI